MAKKNDDSNGVLLPVVEAIKKHLLDLTPRKRAVAEFVLQNPESIAFLSISELARRGGVSEATVVRFCTALGYGGYADLAKETKQVVQAELGTVGRFNLVNKIKNRSASGSAHETFEVIVSTEIQNIANMRGSIRRDDFERCVDLMAKADRICIVGAMGSSGLADYFGYSLAKIFPQVDVLGTHNAITNSIIGRLITNSVAFLIAFPRYPTMTFELGKMISARGARVVAITDAPISPVVRFATTAFFIPLEMTSFVDSHAAPFAFINALIVALSARNPDATQRSLKDFDEYVARNDLFVHSLAR